MKMAQETLCEGFVALRRVDHPNLNLARDNGAPRATKGLSKGLSKGRRIVVVKPRNAASAARRFS